MPGSLSLCILKVLKTTRNEHAQSPPDCIPNRLKQTPQPTYPGFPKPYTPQALWALKPANPNLIAATLRCPKPEIQCFQTKPEAPCPSPTSPLFPKTRVCDWPDVEFADATSAAYALELCLTGTAQGFQGLGAPPPPHPRNPKT